MLIKKYNTYSRALYAELTLEIHSLLHSSQSPSVCYSYFHKISVIIGQNQQRYMQIFKCLLKTGQKCHICFFLTLY